MLFSCSRHVDKIGAQFYPLKICVYTWVAGPKEFDQEISRFHGITRYYAYSWRRNDTTGLTARFYVLPYQTTIKKYLLDWQGIPIIVTNDFLILFEDWPRREL